MLRKLNRIGETNTNNQGLKMKIVEYRKADDIDVQFEDGFIFKNTQYYTFKRGEIRNPYYPTVSNIGYIGIGNYKSKENGKHTKSYATWNCMIKRCYSEKFQEKHPTYIGCTVCKEWHNFQMFAKWFDENVWSEDCIVLDKDILIKGNKIYSSQTCILVDQRINSLFTKADKNRGKYPIGVSYNKIKKKFETQCSIIANNKTQCSHVGNYNTPQEAFDVYKIFKENYIKQVANEYKINYHNFPQKLYDAMCNYEVSIDD